MAEIPAGLLAYIKQASAQAPALNVQAPTFAPDQSIRDKAKRAYEQQQAQEAANKIQGIIGSPAEQQREMGPPTPDGQMSIEGAINATGLFGDDPNRFTQAASQMIQSGNPMLQQQGLDMLDKIQSGDISRRGSNMLPNDAREFEFYKKLSAEDKQSYLTRKRANSRIVNIGGVDTRVSNDVAAGAEGVQQPLNTLANEADAQGFLAEEKARRTGLGENLAKYSDNAMKSYEVAVSQAGLLDKAVQALDDGASSSALAKYTPTIRESTARLKAVGNELALNLLRTVTMGALSKSEMDILQQTVMPNMPAPDLRKWLLKRKEAQLKLSDLYIEASRAYDGGESKADFFTRKKQEFFDAKRVNLPEGTEGIGDGMFRLPDGRMVRKKK